MKRVAIASLCAGLLLLTLFGTVVPAASAQDTPQSTVTLIVKMAPGVSPTDAENTIRRYGGTPKSSIAPLRMYVVEVPAELAESIKAQLQADPKVERVEEDKSRRLSSTPSDGLYSSQWALPKIKWDEVYGTLLPIAQIDVAVLDTGIDAAHPDLIGAIGPGTSFVDSSEGRTDLNGHGTWVSGIVAGRTNNIDGVAGVAYSNVQILPVKVLDGAGEGQDSDIISGIIWAVDRRASVILMAFSNPGFSQNLQDAIDYAWSRGAVLVAAAGNDGSNAAAFPAGDKSVVGVSATDESDALATGSNYGPSIFMAAPGTNIVSTYKGGGYVTSSGTSASAALVAGAAALMRAVDPSLSNGAVVGRLARNADPAGAQGETGNGRLQIARALADTATDEVQPAGAPPVGDGGPFVGPYRAAACTVSGVSVVSQTPSPATAGQTITYSAITLTKSNGNCSGNWTINWIGETPAGTSASFSPATFSGSGTTKTTTLTITTTAGLTTGGTKNFTVTAGGSDTGGSVTSSNFTFVLNKVSSTTTVTVADATHDGSPHGGTASVTGDGGLNQAWIVTYEGRNSTVYGPSTTAPTNAGDYKASASYPGDDTYDSSSDSKNFTIAKATSMTVVTCPVSVNYTGSAQTPCTATVTGAGALSLTPTPNHSNNTNAGTATASYTYAGDANHAGSSGSENFTIDQASSMTTVSCPANVTFNGSAQTPCTATVTGAGGLNLAPTPTYSNNTNAGLPTASYTYPGDANHSGSSDSENFTIDPASSTTTVSCPANVTFNGFAQTPCTTTVTGAGGLSLTPTPNYSNNTNAGLATASYTYAGDANHTGSSDSKNFTIDHASSMTTVTCPAHVTFDGSAQGPCSATVTGAGGLSLTPTPTYSNNTNAGTATASYTFAGDANHTSSSDSKNFTIDPASSMTTVTCPAHVTFDGSAQGPCSATVTGAGGLSLTPTPTYSNNTNAGTATASYTYAGDANHTGSSDSKNFTIDPASSTTTVTCPANVTFNGSAQTPCTATVTGAGGLSLTPTPTYSNNTNAGTATAGYTYPGDANHTGSSDSKNFTIDPASSTTTVTCPANVTFDGSAKTPCTATVTGPGGLNLAPTPNYSNNTNAGTATASYTYPGDANHTSSNDSKIFTIDAAPSTTTVTCPANVTFDGAAKTPCTTTVTGAGGLSLTPTPTYSNNTNAGTSTASYTYPGDANHTSSNDSKIFTIDQASSTTTVTCPANVTFNGSAQTPCTTTVTSAGGLSLTPTPTYSNNTNAGTATASYTYPGDANHTSSNDSKIFTIDQASSTTTVTCPANVTFNGSAQSPCSATVTGAGELNLSPTPTYSNNTNAGSATASYTYPGDANHSGSSDSENFTIDAASSTTTVTCPANVTFNGSAQTPCSATVTGADGLSLTPTPNYSNNTNAGSATASYTYPGDANHTDSSDSKNFTINPASSTTIVTCPANVTFNGSAQTPCTATVTGAGGWNLTPTPTYSNNTNAGTATASYTYAGGANHTASSDSENFTISPALASILLSNLVQGFTGGPLQPNAITTPPGIGYALTFGGSTIVPSAPGVYTAVATIANSNYMPVTDTALFVIYDPSGGFVTGGGWINSPIGACRFAACTNETVGKANFGFNSKYQKGATRPTGNTEFQFQTGGLNFKSTDYEWLVVSGTTKAQFKGSGTINGVGNYGFILTAIDGNNFGNAKPDAFRIKIWNMNDGNGVVYDNQMGKAENGDDATILGNNGLGGGSIVIHDSKK